MGAMYRVKAYFGMVPAEEMGDYVDEPVPGPYGPRRGDRWDDEPEPAADRYDEWERRSSRELGRPPTDAPASSPAAESVGPAPVGVGAPVHGALAVEPDPALREPVSARLPAPPPPVPEQRDRVLGAAALSRITTLHPRSYNEARTIGERYRDGVPVIMNLTELDDAAAKRLVDFAAGLAFALRGSIDKVTNRVFLLTPADVEVSADDARRLAARTVRIDAERGLFRPD